MTTANVSRQAALTQERLRELLHYDPETGDFTRRVARGSDKAGAKAGCIGQFGYVKICIDKNHFVAHRVAVLYMTGRWPADEVDHADGVRSNNRWANLRECNIYENRQNLATRKKSSTGLSGAYRTSDGKRWRSRIRANGTAIFLGNFETAEAAHAAYLEAKARLHTFNPTVRGLSAPSQTG